MPIKSRVRDGVTILDLNGKIGDTALRQAIHEALGAGAAKILLNFSGVAVNGWPEIGALVEAYTVATNRGAKLKIANLPPGINDDILYVTQLITIFDVFDSEDEAVKSFA